MATKKGKRWVRCMDLIAAGKPTVDGTIAAAARQAHVDRDEYLVSLATTSDDAGPSRDVALGLWITGAQLGELVASARAAGWQGR